jgi:hypothetical protein
MRGIHAIRVALVLCGSLAAITGSGCRSDCQSLWDLGKSLKEEKKDDKKQPDTQPKWNPETGRWDNTEASRLTPERIHGGIIE